MTGPARIEIAGPAGRLSALTWSGPAEATPVLLLHPVNTGAAVWLDVAGDLGRPAVALDYRGHGYSDPGPRYLPADYAADALAVADHLRWSRLHLVGGSIGGAVAVEVAALAPDRVASIACFGSTLRIGLNEEELAPLLDEVSGIGIAEWFARNGAGLVGPAAASGVVERLVELNQGRDLATVVDIVRDTFCRADSRATAAGLRRPLPAALVAVGSDDPTCPLPMAEELAHSLGTEPVVLPGIGHLPMIEAPDQMVALLDKLHSLDPCGAGI